MSVPKRNVRWKSVREQAVARRTAAGGAEDERRRDRPGLAAHARGRNVSEYDPRDRSGMRALSPYEASYDITHGYAHERSIVLP